MDPVEEQQFGAPFLEILGYFGSHTGCQTSLDLSTLGFQIDEIESGTDDSRKHDGAEG
jgi:hypothetical protein